MRKTQVSELLDEISEELKQKGLEEQSQRHEATEEIRQYEHACNAETYLKAAMIVGRYRAKLTDMKALVPIINKMLSNYNSTTSKH